MMNKMESAIHTISETCQGISRMIAIHEERIEGVHKTDNLILEKFKEMETRNILDHDKVIKKVEKLEGKVEGLTNFRWLIGGAIALTVFFFYQNQIRFADYLPKPEASATVKSAN